MHTDHAGQRVAVLHDGERRDGVDTEHRSEVRLLVDVDLAELDLVLFPVELGKDRRHHLARLAPLGPEVDDDEARIVEYLSLEDNFQTEVLDDPGLVIIDFWAEWCQPCKMMAPVFAELNGEEDKVKFCKVNVDEQPNLASMFGIDSIPTLAVVQDRHTLTGMVGVHDKADIKAMLEKCKS